MNAIIYARFSPRPDAATSESIDLQVEKCSAYAAFRQYYIVQTHSEREISGARADNRPALQKAVREACSAKGVLICYSLSRLARNTRDALEISARLEKAGAHLALLDMQVDTSSAAGRMFFTIMASFAQFEREQVSQRTSDAMQRKQSKGMRMSRYAPWGFRLMGKELYPDQRERALAVRIHKMAELGMTPYAICQSLETTGVKARGKRWYIQTVQGILSTPQP